MVRTVLSRVSWRTLTLVCCESVLVAAGVVGASYLRLGGDLRAMLADPASIAKMLLVTGVCQVCLYYTDLYDMRVVSDRRDLFVRSLQALGATSLLLAAIYYWFPNLIIGRGVFMIAVVFVVTVVLGWRVAFEWATRHVRARERLLLVGTSQAAVRLARELHQRRAELGVDIVGFVDFDPGRVGMPLINPGIIGTIADVPRIARERSVDRVVVSLADARGRLPMESLLDMRVNDGIRFDHLASVYEEYTGKIAVENLRPSWFIFSADGFYKARVRLAIKRIIDVTAAGVAIVLLLPLTLIVALAVKLTSPGPALYHQARVGRHGHTFTVHKFRSMCADAEAGTGAVWAKPGADPRVTPIGRFLRRSRIDELPQLWNVLKGDMSLVGPRPERPEFVQELTVEIPFYGQRHVVKPGLTGWAQVRYTYGATREDAMEKLQYDLYYIKNMSIAFDLYIIFDTAKTVLTRSGS
jgi:sugar transferase (PEP-CTERM system associated)